MSDVLDALASALCSMRTPPVREAMLDALKHRHVAQWIVISVSVPRRISPPTSLRVWPEGPQAAVLNQTGSGLADQLLDLQRDDVVLMLACANVCGGI